jgi:hypothetical protein
MMTDFIVAFVLGQPTPDRFMVGYGYASQLWGIHSVNHSIFTRRAAATLRGAVAQKMGKKQEKMLALPVGLPYC